MHFGPSLLAAMAIAVAGQAPPPSPEAQQMPPLTSSLPPAGASAWACTRKTLIDQAPCTIEGRTAAASASKDQAKENQRQAKVLADDVCNTLAENGSPEPNAAVLAVCTQRAGALLKRCGGDGSRRLVDDAGRFNPGHARCYAALSELVRDMSAIVDTAAGCCACIHDSCNGNEEQCVMRMADDKPPEASQACLSGVCSDTCAQAKLFAPAAPSAPASSKGKTP